MTSLREFLSRPMSSGENDRLIGYDELGREVFETPLGHRYAMTEQERTSPAQMRNALADAASDPLGTARGVALAIAEGAWNGVSAPGRALQGETLTYGDVADTAMDWGVMSAVGRAPQGALRAGAMLDDAAETPAQTVSRLLREGRASEVTDDLMAQVDPQEMARLYESGATGMDMPLDEASRMARARKMGFDTDTPLYHGTTRNFPAFDLSRVGAANDEGFYGRGVYTTPNPRLASDYAWELSPSRGGEVLPVYAAGEHLPLNQSSGHSSAVTRSIYDELPGSAPELPLAIADAPQLQAFAEGAGRSGVDVRVDSLEPYGLDVSAPIHERVTFDPRNIRSRFARFDPRLSHLANLSAGIGAGAVMLSQQDEENALARLRAYLDQF